MKLITRDSPREVVESRSGGKGRNLWALTREGLPVPEWAIVGIDVFRHFRRLHGLDERIGALVSGVTANSAGPVARTIE